MDGPENYSFDQSNRVITCAHGTQGGYQAYVEDDNGEEGLSRPQTANEGLMTQSRKALSSSRASFAHRSSLEPRSRSSYVRERTGQHTSQIKPESQAHAQRLPIAQNPKVMYTNIRRNAQPNTSPMSHSNTVGLAPQARSAFQKTPPASIHYTQARSSNQERSVSPTLARIQHLRRKETREPEYQAARSLKDFAEEDTMELMMAQIRNEQHAPRDYVHASTLHSHNLEKRGYTTRLTEEQIAEQIATRLFAEIQIRRNAAQSNLKSRSNDGSEESRFHTPPSTPSKTSSRHHSPPHVQELPEEYAAVPSQMPPNPMAVALTPLHHASLIFEALDLASRSPSLDSISPLAMSLISDSIHSLEFTEAAVAQPARARANPLDDMGFEIVEGFVLVGYENITENEGTSDLDSEDESDFDNGFEVIAQTHLSHSEHNGTLRRWYRLWRH